MYIARPEMYIARPEIKFIQAQRNCSHTGKIIFPHLGTKKNSLASNANEAVIILV
jgi:hypothetical protein